MHIGDGDGSDGSGDEAPDGIVCSVVSKSSCNGECILFWLIDL